MRIPIPFTKSYIAIGGGYWGLGSYGGGLPFIRESFGGAWQRNVLECDSRQDLTAFSAVYACISLIAEDIAKLPMQLVEQDSHGVWNVVDSPSPFALLLLKRPNQYQVWQQFISSWLVWKLMWGNAYIYIEMDGRGIPSALHVLDPRRVSVRINDSTGDVFYALNVDPLAQISDTDTIVPARFIIHDRCITLWHPLVGVSPIYACAMSVMQGRMIQNNAARFFKNMSRPSGQLTAPGTISDETAARLKKEFEDSQRGENIGRLLVTGDGLKYEAMPPMPAADAQLIEQLQWTAVDVARCFKIPPYKIGASPEPKFTNYTQLQLDYFTQVLQSNISVIEALMDEGLGLWGVSGHRYETRFNLEELLRMDPLSRADLNSKSVSGGWLTPNEARASENLPPVEGGDVPYMQQQNWPLNVLSERTVAELQPAAPAAAAAPAAEAGDSATSPPDTVPTKALEMDAEELALELVALEMAHG